MRRTSRPGVWKEMATQKEGKLWRKSMNSGLALSGFGDDLTGREKSMESKMTSCERGTGVSSICQS